MDFIKVLGYYVLPQSCTGNVIFKDFALTLGIQTTLNECFRSRIFFSFPFRKVCFIEKHIIGETFGCINYADSQQTLSALARQICHFPFAYKSVTIQSRENIPMTIEYSKWQEDSTSHVEKFYKSHGRFLESVILIPFSINQWNKAINLDVMKTWCSMSHDNPSLIIPNYNIMDHYGIYDISEELLTSKLSIKCFPKNNNRLLVFNAAYSVLLNIRVATDTTLKDEVDYSINDVNLLLLLLRDILKGSGLVVTGLVAYSGNNIHLKNKCHNCHHLIVSKDVFASNENFDKFWRSYSGEKVFGKLKEGLTAATNKKQVSMAILKKFLAYITQYQFRVCKEPVLPMNKRDAAEAIIEAELLSERYQLDIAYSVGKFTILKGDFGTGKTFICVKMIEFLASKLEKREMLYFVSFHFKSELDCTVRKLVERLHPNIKVLKGNSDLSNIIEFQILQKEERKGTTKIDLIVDEFNAETLVKGEARRLRELLKRKKQFKNSTILIAVHPMQMERVDFHHVYGEESGYLEKGNMFGELEDIMEVKHLSHAMRTTVENYSFIKVSQEYLDEKSNLYHRCRDTSDQKQKVSSNRKTHLKRHMKSVDDNVNVTIEATKINTGREGDSLSFTKDPKFEPNVTFEGKELKPQSNSLLKFSSTNSQSQPRKAIDYDELHKLTHTSNTVVSEDYQKRVTTYRYFSFSNIGHTITGPVPNLIKLPPCTILSESVGLFAIMFMAIQSENKRTALIHFELENPQWLCKLFKFSTVFKNLRVTDDVGEFLSKSNEDLILIKNYNYVRGLEFANVIIILDEDEYHLKQFIPEAMARCMKNLSIVIKAGKNEMEGFDTVMELLNHWEIVNIERQEQPIAKSLQFQFCGCISDFLCEQDALKGNGYYRMLSGNDAEACYQVHRKSTLCKELLKEIQLEVIPYMESDDQIKREEAVTL